MAMENTVAFNMCEFLNQNFLFNNDINSIHLLLNLYDLENNISNIFPKYLSMKGFRKDIARLLRTRKGKYLIASNLGKLIHEDINRLELFLYLEGYKSGYLNKTLTNKLEDITIKCFPLHKLYNLKYLYHFSSSVDEVAGLKKELFEKLRIDYKNNKSLNKLLSTYIGNIIKPKIFSLNKYMDKQLTIDCNSDYGYIKEEETILTLNELDRIYHGITRLIFKNGLKTYNNAYWHGLNDSLLKRYN